MWRNRFPAVAGAALVSAAAVIGVGAAVSAADDAGDYDGSKCGANQFFDASAQGCADSVVTNDPNGVPQPEDIGANYDGTRCAPGQFYDASAASCTLAAVTNDAQTAQVIADGDPMDSDLPVGPEAPPLTVTPTPGVPSNP